MSTARFWFREWEERDFKDPDSRTWNGGTIKQVVPKNPIREDPGFGGLREILEQNFGIDSFRFIYFTTQGYGVFPDLGVATPEGFRKLATPQECLEVFNESLLTKVKMKASWSFRLLGGGQTVRVMESDYIAAEIGCLRRLWQQGYYVMELD